MVFSTLDDVQKALQKHLHGTVIRSTYRDAVTGVGMSRLFPHYAIVTLHETKEVAMLRSQHPVISVEGLHEKVLERTQGTNSIDPLAVPAVLETITELPGPERYLLPYEVSPDTYAALQEQGWHICAMPPDERSYLDAKDTFLTLTKEADIPVPHSIHYPSCTRSDVEEFFQKEGRSVLQGLGAAAGMDTYFLFSEEDIQKLEDVIIEGPRRMTRYIEGVAVSCEGCVLKDQVLVSPPRAQVIGCSELSSGPAHYCGNDWNIQLPPESRQELQRITERMGTILRGHGYKGIFGIDAVWEQSTGKVYAIELNPRLLGTSQLYILQQMEADEPPMIGLHVLSFLGVDCSVPEDVASAMAERAMTGAHLIMRNTESHSVTVGGNIEPGIYAVHDSEVRFLRPAASFSDIESTEEYLVTMVPSVGKALGPNAQMIRIQARTQCYDAQNHALLPAARALVGWLRTALELRPA